MKKQTNYIPIMLKLFDEGGAAGGEGVSSSPSSTADSQVATDNSADNAQSTEGVDVDAEFEELIKGKYKDAYSKKFKAGMNERFKNISDSEKKLNETEAVLKRVAEMTGNADITDLSALMSRIDALDPHLEQEALERNLPPEQLLHIKEMERQIDSFNRAEQQRLADEQANRQMQQWLDEAEGCMEYYGDQFNLEAELQNPEFESLIKSGYPMKKAFEVVHLDELVGGAMKFAAKTTEKNIANDIKARGNRPVENGAHSTNPVKTSVNINELTSEEFSKLTEQSMAGKIKSPEDAARYIAGLRSKK